MEKRKRDQVMKQKEEAAQKKKSDLELELLKRQQKLEQVSVVGGLQGWSSCIQVQFPVQTGGAGLWGTFGATLWHHTSLALYMLEP